MAGLTFKMKHIAELRVALDVGFHVGAVRDDFPAEAAGFQQGIVGEMGGDAFATKGGRDEGVLDDDGIATFPVGEHGGFAGAGSQFKALFAGVMDGLVGHDCGESLCANDHPGVAPGKVKLSISTLAHGVHFPENSRR